MNDTHVRAYTICRLNKNNLQDLSALYAEVYGRNIPKDYFPRKYNTAYAGVEHVGFIAYTGQQPIAYYGVIPCHIQYGDEIILAAQSADTMTHPGHRYKGMFVELSQKTFELCRSLGINLVFGFPNQNSYHGAVHKLGWKPGEAMDCFILPVPAFPLYRISQKFGFLKKWYLRYYTSVLKKYEVKQQAVPNSVLGDGFAGIHRNKEYLQTKSPGSSVIHVQDSKIWFRHKGPLLIGDMEGVNEKNFPTVINFLKLLARRLGITEIQFHSSPGTALHQLFSRHYSPTPSYPVLFQDFGSPVPREKIRFQFADIDIF